MRDQEQKRRLRISTAPGALLAAAAINMTAPAIAQNASQTESPPAAETSQADILEEVTVTAERRESSVQTTALSIAAVSGDALRSQQVTNIEGLSQRIPNLTFGRNAGDAKVFIRGVGYDSISPGGETRVALYNDGIYQSRSQSALAGFFDVDRVEVLRGPQGTLYGRNATAGAINILTREPTQDLEGYFSATVGSYDLLGAEGAIGGGLSETLSGRLAFRTVDRNGYGKNITTGAEVDDEASRSARLKLSFEPFDTLSFRLGGDYSIERAHSGGYRYVTVGRTDTIPTGLAIGGLVPSDVHDAAGFGPRNRIETYGVFGEADWQINDATHLVSLTGHRHLSARNESTVDGSSAFLALQWLDEESDAVSQELRLSHEFNDFASILLGGYYFHERNAVTNKIPFMALAVGIPSTDLVQGYEAAGTATTDAYAAFIQAKFNLTTRLTLTLGGRYSDEQKDIEEEAQFDVTRPFNLANPRVPFGTGQQSLSLTRTDPQVTLDYKFTPNIFAYVTYSRGFKSGGFNIGGLQPPFQPEVITDYEGGIKAELFDRQLRVNLAGFHYDYDNLQVNVVEGVALVTHNAASAEVNGFEAEITALPVDNLRLSLNVGYLDSKYLNFMTADPAYPERGVQDLAGNRLNYSPKWKIDSEIGYTFDSSWGEVTPRLNVTWIDSIYFSQFNLPREFQPSRTEVNLYLNYESSDGTWAADAYVKNLTDKDYIAGAVLSAGIYGFPVVGQYGPPRTLGVTVSRRF